MPQNTQYDRVKEITDQLEDGIAQLFESDQYMQWLTTMSRFHDYSLNNTILIAMQKPDATLVAGYTAWQSSSEDRSIRVKRPYEFWHLLPTSKRSRWTKLTPIPVKF